MKVSVARAWRLCVCVCVCQGAVSRGGSRRPTWRTFGGVRLLGDGHGGRSGTEGGMFDIAPGSIIKVLVAVFLFFFQSKVINILLTWIGRSPSFVRSQWAGSPRTQRLISSLILILSAPGLTETLDIFTLSCLGTCSGRILSGRWFPYFLTFLWCFSQPCKSFTTSTDDGVHFPTHLFCCCFLGVDKLFNTRGAMRNNVQETTQRVHVDAVDNLV